MANEIRSIPRPLVKTNQWVIVLSVILTWFTGYEWLLLIPFTSGALGLVFDFNPIMRLAKLFLKKDIKSYIPEDWEQQQFNQKIAVICLGLAYIGFLFNLNTIGYIFSALVGIAAFVAISGFCIGCFILFQWKQYQYRRTQHQKG